MKSAAGGTGDASSVRLLWLLLLHDGQMTKNSVGRILTALRERRLCMSALLVSVVLRGHESVPLAPRIRDVWEPS